MQKLGSYLLTLTMLTFGAVAAHSAPSEAEHAVHRFPRIVATHSETVTTPTGTVPVTTIFIPEESGLYRISLYWIQTTSPAPCNSCNDQLNFNFYWTDDAGPQTCFDQQCTFYTFNPLSFQQPTPVTLDMLVRVNAGTPLQYQIGVGPQTDGGATYEYYFTVEQLIRSSGR
jgi:hypothetical protein